MPSRSPVRHANGEELVRSSHSRNRKAGSCSALLVRRERRAEMVYWRKGARPRTGRDHVLGHSADRQGAGRILESTAPSSRARSCGRQSTDLFPTRDAAWVERHLRRLTGLERGDGAEDRRDEAFAAWRRFHEAIADDRPLVLVLEDVHWADDALLDFVEYLVDWASGVPLLLMCTARPELLTRRPGWGAQSLLEHSRVPRSRR